MGIQQLVQVHLQNSMAQRLSQRLGLLRGRKQGMWGFINLGLISICCINHIHLKLNAMEKFPKYNSPNSIFRINLTKSQMLVMDTMLPPGHTFQVESKKQRSSKIVEAPHIQAPLLESVHQNSDLSKPQKLQSAVPSEFQPSLKILGQLKSHKNSWPFLEPLDAQNLGIPFYFQIVKDPIDLSTIEVKLFSDEYGHPAEFHTDVARIFENSYLFNSGNPQFIKLTSDFQKYYHRIAAADIKKISLPDSKKANPSPQRQVKKKPRPLSTKDKTDNSTINIKDRIELSQSLKLIAKEFIPAIKRIVFQNNSSEKDQFDLNKLPPKKIKELQKFLRLKKHSHQQRRREEEAEKKAKINLDECESDFSAFLDSEDCHNHMEPTSQNE